MGLISRYHKKCRIAYLKVAIYALAASALFLPTLEPIKSVGYNLFSIYVNGKNMGTADTHADAERLLNDARRKVAGGDANIVLIKAESEIIGKEILKGKCDPEETVLANIVAEYESSVKETMQHSYTVKIDDFMINVSNKENVIKLLEASVGRYDTEGKFDVKLIPNNEREVLVLVPEIIRTSGDDKLYEEPDNVGAYLSSEGFYQGLKDAEDVVANKEPETFEDYEYGLKSISFANNVEVVESYLPSNQISNINDAIEAVTKDKEEKTFYEVVSGDTLSGISKKTGISVDDLIALNDSLTSDRSIIRVGDMLTITVPKPELSVEREELVYYEGTYEADIIYVYNDNWYTSTEVTLQDPSSGYHKAVRKITYLDGSVTSSEVIKEEIVAEAVPKIVEKGTKIPPTYIKPVSYGRVTSYFGWRVSTFAGMLPNHTGVDWGVKKGTTVVASSGGTVLKAGWERSYGYVIYINHPDGKQTRYAHLSKIYVSAGQKVAQGERIALSGDSGDVNGPHLHFEIVVNGKRVNPLNYVNQ